MSSPVSKEYSVIFFYWLLLIVDGVVEAGWLRKKHWTKWGKALLFSLLTNLIGHCIGFFLLFITVGITLALAWDGSMERLPFGGNEAGVALVLVVLLLPTLLMLIKRVGLIFLRTPNRQAWLFSLISSILFWVAPLGISILVALVLSRAGVL